MKQLLCPLNGLRNISEFTYGGEFHAMPDPQRCDRRAWAEHVFSHDNHAGVVLEWWCHTPTSYWFLAERDTRSDEIIRTIAPGDSADIRSLEARFRTASDDA